MPLANNRITLAWPNRIEQAALEGGSWLPTLPLENAQKMPYARKARTNGILSNSPDSKNLIIRSENIDNVAWYKVGLTPTADVLTDSQGNLTLEKLVETATNGEHFIEQYPNLAVAEKHTAQWEVYPAERTKIRLSAYSYNVTAVYCVVVFDLATLTFSAPSGYPGVVQTYGCEVSTDGRIRIWHTINLVGKDQKIIMRLSVYNGGTSYLGDITKGLYVGRSMLSKGDLVDYIATTTLPVEVLLASQFTVKLDKLRNVGVLALASHNLSPSAQLRIRGYDNYSRASWDLDTDVKTISASATLSPQDGFMAGLRLSSNGSNLYSLGGTTSKLYQYQLTTNWDVTTKSASATSFDFSAQCSAAKDFCFSINGLNLYIADYLTESVYQYSLSTAWNITTATYLASFSVATELNGPQGIDISANGLMLLVSDQQVIHQYTLATTMLISTASYASKSLNVAAQETDCRSIFLHPNGGSIYIVGLTTKNVYQYSLTAGDISTGAYTGKFYSITNEATPHGLDFRADGKEFYVIGSTNNVAYRYQLNLDPVYDSGRINAWPASYLPESYEFGDVGFWEAGGNLPDQATKYTPTTAVFFGTSYNLRSLYIEIFDANNNDGYVEIGRVFVSDCFQPQYNASYGIEHGMVNDTQVDKALDGTEYFDVKKVRRTVKFTLKYLSMAEAFQQLYPMDRDLGIDKEILYAYEINPSGEFYHRTFIGRLVAPDPIIHPYPLKNAKQVNILENQ